MRRVFTHRFQPFPSSRSIPATESSFLSAPAAVGWSLMIFCARATRGVLALCTVDGFPDSGGMPVTRILVLCVSEVDYGENVVLV